MIRCSICRAPIDFDEREWFILTNVDDGDPTTGFLCSLAHLTDYVAKVYAMLAQ